MRASTITVSQETRRLLKLLKSGGATYDDVIRAILVAHPTELTAAELARRIRQGKPRPIEKLLRRSREQPY
ncbi:MAG: hypothetical protein L3K15_00035 [Thermoplasmata archaeon]|nr:hypothetical protein [Thermoplasmata archaeon]